MKKLLIILMAAVMGLSLAACGGAGQGGNNGSGAASGDKNNGLTGYYEIVYREGSEISEEDIRILSGSGQSINLTINEDGSAVLNSIGTESKLTFDPAKMTLKGEQGTMKVSFENNILKLDEDGALLFFEKVDTSVPRTPADLPEEPRMEADDMKRQIISVDGDLSVYVPTQINDIRLTYGGKLTLLTYGDLAANAGETVEVADDVSTMDIYQYGNGGYRVIIFVRNNGTVSAINPTVLIDEHRIEVLDNLGELTNIVAILEEPAEDGSSILTAVDRDGNTTVLDQYF